MTKSFIQANKAGDATSFVGPDAVSLYRATVLQSSLRFYAKTGIKINRAYTPTAMLAAAFGITGKRYKRGEYLKAADDLKTWADAMKAGIPYLDHEGNTI